MSARLACNVAYAHRAEGLDAEQREQLDVWLATPLEVQAGDRAVLRMLGAV